MFESELTDANPNLFYCRLKRTGIVDIQNPVEQAIREGRFQDIKDDERVEELD